MTSLNTVDTAPVITVPIITLDGPSGTGKGTLCLLLARHLGWHMLDSGSIYRVLAYAARKKQVDFADHQSLRQQALDLDLRFGFDSGSSLSQKVFLEGQDVSQQLRTEACGQDASIIAAIPDVREALLARQRAFAMSPGLVTDGRDMGTVVFPNAVLKLYLYANDEIRAQRRYFQLKERGINVTLAQVVDELSKRDLRDSSRLCAPLKVAENAVVLDTSHLNTTQVFENVLTLINGGKVTAIVP